MGSLDGKHALVTGGSRGIGRAIVERLAADGAAVTFCFREQHEAAQQVVDAVGRAGGTAYAVRADVARRGAARLLVDVAEARHGRLDIVVNNAGLARTAPIAELSDDVFDLVLDTNLRSVFEMLREVSTRLNDGGRVVNISTINTVLRGPTLGAYSAAKGAVEQLTVVAAHELGARNITVNAVAPGATDTSGLRSANTGESTALVLKLTPLGRIGEPCGVASVVAFLCGPDGAWMTGQVLYAGGGLGI